VGVCGHLVGGWHIEQVTVILSLAYCYMISIHSHISSVQWFLVYSQSCVTITTINCSTFIAP
jgi:hypothetical protein